ncbi:hypothetical protein [Geopsychrobacter electrodiphilus]|uniref:hypothetical protein n=1 Tax=Geopsychrobacter electrodiphilus TaxID=225196 RepID=UPI0012EB2D3F|nr:hypothetical protein [Geopsychrobacter electrodiphilus]
MNNDQIMWSLAAVLMFLFCCHGGLLLYFCRYLRTRGVADVSFKDTIIMSVTGKMEDFYKAFYATHSQEFGKARTKALIIWQISSLALIVVLPILLALVL